MGKNYSDWIDICSSDDPDLYELVLIKIMANENATLSEALDIDMFNSGIDCESVFDITDYLEERFNDLNKVQYYMMVYTGQAPDVILKKQLNEKKIQEE